MNPRVAMSLLACATAALLGLAYCNGLGKPVPLPTTPPSAAPSLPTNDIPAPSAATAAARTDERGDAESATDAQLPGTADRVAEPPAAAPATDTFAIFGIVRGEDGAPLAGAIVYVASSPVPENYLRIGRLDTEGDDRRRARTAADGSYRLERMPAGTAHVYAVPRLQRRGLSSDPWAEAKLNGIAGATLEWNAQLDPRPMIAGTLRYRDGTPVEAQHVSAQVPGARHLRAVTDHRGQFRFVCLQRQPYDLATVLADAPVDAPPVTARGVWPDQGPLELVAGFDPPTRRQPGSVRGTVLDTGHRLNGAMSVSLILDDKKHNSQSQIDGNSFTFAEVEAGRCRAVVLAGSTPVCASGWFVVRPGEAIDIGTLVTEPAGSLLLRIDRPAGTEGVGVDAYLTQADVTLGQSVRIGDQRELQIANLSPGDCRINCWGRGIAPAEVACTIAAGRTVEATVQLQPAVSREVTVEHPPHRRPTRIRVRDASGHGYLDTEPSTFSPCILRVQLPLGQLTLSAEFEGGGEAHVDFAMTSLTDNQPTVRLVVR